VKGNILALSNTWIVGDLLGGGGYGRVYELVGGDRQAVAKFVPRAPGADRELLFVNLKGSRNIVPILDSGEHRDSWVLVMPRADMSLRQHIDDSGGVLSFEEALSVLLDIATALVDLGDSVVHRDLKPENVLLLEGSWCVADFGISRYAEASTAPDTHKWAMTPAYASPERWRAERATNAADVYSLGAMGFEMLKGHRPFQGPTVEDYRDQHLHSDPPALDGVPVALATVLFECLFKSPATRPSPENLLARLRRQREAPATGGLAALQVANQIEVRRRVESDREASVAVSASERRADRGTAAKATYELITSALRDAVMDAAPAASLKKDRNAGYARKLGWTIRLGSAELIATDCTARQANWGGWESPAFEVNAWGSLGVRIPKTSYEYEGRAHSLWFGDIHEQGRFGWFETSFMLSPLGRRRSTLDPFDLDPDEDAAKAVWNGVSGFQVAWPFTRLDPENLGDFIERWAAWFALAASGALSRPSTMPERPSQNTWRRG